MEPIVTLLIVCLVCLLISLALYLKGDVKALFKLSWLTLLLEAKDKRGTETRAVKRSGR